jgi:hypothetical protein
MVTAVDLNFAFTESKTFGSIKDRMKNSRNLSRREFPRTAIGSTALIGLTDAMRPALAAPASPHWLTSIREVRVL